MRALFAIMLLGLSACAATLQPPGPAPSPPALEADALRTTDGLRLPLKVWRPLGPPTAVVVALHGFNDYSNAFALPAPKLARHGVLFYAYDQRGFGGGPYPGLWPGTQPLVDDLTSAVELARQANPGVPLYVLGESMGGAVVLTALAQNPSLPVDGAILVAPAVWGRNTMPWYQRVALWGARYTVPWLTLTGRGLGRLPTDNLPLLRRMSRDPLVIKETRVDAIAGLADLMDEAFMAAPRVRTPLFLLYGKDDQIIPAEPVDKVIDSLPDRSHRRQRIAIYPKGYHMLLRDLESGPVVEDIAAWIAAPDGRLPSGADLPARRDVAADGK